MRKYRKVLCPDGVAANTQLSLLEESTMIQNPDDPATVYARMPDGHRLIFRKYKYQGWDNGG